MPAVPSKSWLVGASIPHAAGREGDGEDPRCITGLVASRREGRNTTSVVEGELEGWYRDPFGMHELRYYSGGRPTRLVRDGGREFYEPPSGGAAQSRPPDSSANWARRDPGAGYGRGAGGVGPDPGAYGGHPGANQPYCGRPGAYGREYGDYGQESGAYADQPYDGRQAGYGYESRRYGTEPGGSREPDFSQGRSHARSGRRGSAKKRGVAALAVVAVAVVGAGVAFVALRGNGGNSSLTPVAFVKKAATKTMAQQTAEVTVSGTIQASGRTASLHGTGQLDLAGKAVNLNLSASVPGGSGFQEHEIVSGGTVYLQLVAGGRNIFQAATGKPWLAIPVGGALQSGSTSTTDANPASSLAILQQKGAKVTTLGSRSINGQNCDGYRVTPSKQAMIASAKKEWAKFGLTKAQTRAALQQLQNTAPPTMKVWFDPQRQLACQMDVAMQTGGMSSASASAHMTMTFANYGEPVHIRPPASSQTATPRQLARAGQ